MRFSLNRGKKEGMEKARFVATVARLPEILGWVRKRLVQKGMEAKIIRRLELALEEAIVNVIRHGYRGKEGEVEIALEWKAKEIKIHVKDWGPPFNPSKDAPFVDPEAPLSEREEGGLGIYLMRKSVDEVLYLREQDGNLLTLIKRFS